MKVPEGVVEIPMRLFAQQMGKGLVPRIMDRDHEEAAVISPNLPITAAWCRGWGRWGTQPKPGPSASSWESGTRPESKITQRQTSVL